MNTLASGVLASGLTVSGPHGVLILLAMILFIIAGFLAWFIAPRAIWASLISGGLALYMLALLWAG